jgi:hypothetical protein
VEHETGSRCKSITFSLLDFLDVEIVLIFLFSFLGSSNIYYNSYHNSRLSNQYRKSAK